MRRVLMIIVDIDIFKDNANAIKGWDIDQGRLRHLCPLVPMS